MLFDAVSNRQLFHRNDVETTSFRGIISDWSSVSIRVYTSILKLYIKVIYYIYLHGGCANLNTFLWKHWMDAAPTKNAVKKT